MATKYRAHVFGKQGCKKCHVLNERLDKMLGDGPWVDFEKVYSDVETEDGILTLCETECLNPQRIPAMLVERFDPDRDRYEPVRNPKPGDTNPVYKNSKLYQHLGLQTNYTAAGGGVISPHMITSCLEEAKGLEAVAESSEALSCPRG